MIRRLKWTGETEIFIIGFLFEPDVYYTIQPYDIRRFQEFEELKTMIDDGLLVVNDGSSDLNIIAGYSYFMAAQTFASSFALDLDNIDQVVTGDDPVVIEATRKLWDLLDDYDLGDFKFYPPIDGIWNANGTITVKYADNVAKVQIEIFRNDEPWFTVAQAEPDASGLTFIPFSCDVDAYKSEGHDFDLRIHLEKIVPADPCSITISGSDEETAWGMTFLQQLVTPSPT
jgi:hypothetical protein